MKDAPRNSVPSESLVAEPSVDVTPLPLAAIETAIRSIRYGVVQVVIQDGIVVQIDKTEKLRLR